MAKRKRLTLAALSAYCRGLEERIGKTEKGCRRCVNREPVGFRVADAVGGGVEQDDDDSNVEELP